MSLPSENLSINVNAPTTVNLTLLCESVCEQTPFRRAQTVIQRWNQASSKISTSQTISFPIAISTTFVIVDESEITQSIDAPPTINVNWHLFFRDPATYIGLIHHLTQAFGISVGAIFSEVIGDLYECYDKRKLLMQTFDAAMSAFHSIEEMIESRIRQIEATLTTIDNQQIQTDLHCVKTYLDIILEQLTTWKTQITTEINQIISSNSFQTYATFLPGMLALLFAVGGIATGGNIELMLSIPIGLFSFIESIIANLIDDISVKIIENVEAAIRWAIHQAGVENLFEDNPAGLRLQRIKNQLNERFRLRTTLSQAGRFAVESIDTPSSLTSLITPSEAQLEKNMKQRLKSVGIISQSEFSGSPRSVIEIQPSISSAPVRLDHSDTNDPNLRQRTFFKL